MYSLFLCLISTAIRGQVVAMPHYKLHYFNVRERGELPRIMFAAAGVPFEDHRIENKDWLAQKPSVFTNLVSMQRQRAFLRGGVEPTSEHNCNRCAQSSRSSRCLCSRLMASLSHSQALSCYTLLKPAVWLTRELSYTTFCSMYPV